MSLAQVLYPPNGEIGLQQWLFWHAQDHLAIQSAIASASLGIISLPVYVLDPVSKTDYVGFGLRHQSAHNDFNQLLGTQGSDLQSVEFNDPGQLRQWLYLNFQEHSAAHARLGI